MMSVVKYKRCRGDCKLWLPERFFPKVYGVKTRDMHTPCYRSRVCMGCRDKKKDEKKAQNRFRQKARDTIARHARKYVQTGIVKSKDDFCQTFGWTVKQLAKDMKFRYENSCPVCHRQYREMGHGTGDLTIDIINVDLLPYYESNVRCICMTCNRRKQRTPPDDLGEVMLGWRIWDEHQEKLEEDPWAGTLFEGIKELQQVDFCN